MPTDFNELLTQFWTVGEAKCPHDGQRLECHLHKQENGYLLVMACMRCGRKSQFTRYSDPLRVKFRPWTASDIAALEPVLEGDTCACPVCRSRVTRTKGHLEFEVSINCPRCGNVYLFSTAQDFANASPVAS